MLLTPQETTGRLQNPGSLLSSKILCIKVEQNQQTKSNSTSKTSTRIKKWIYMKKSPPTRCFGPVCHFFRDILVRKSPWVEATAGTCLLIVPLWNGGGLASTKWLFSLPISRENKKVVQIQDDLQS